MGIKLKAIYTFVFSIVLFLVCLGSFVGISGLSSSFFRGLCEQAVIIPHTFSTRTVIPTVSTRKLRN